MFHTGGLLLLHPWDRTIVPWLHSNEPGYVYDGNKFDLDEWNPEFSARLNDLFVKGSNPERATKFEEFHPQL